MKHIILGTAGHIDHGKSSLVKALTGVDPDRLKEEKDRGITIDLGFADLKYDGLTVGIIDVPGHERLIKNMLAGAGCIDMVMLVISAEEGVMPQSREHLAICDLLDCKSGIVALTKSDIVDTDLIELVRMDVIEFVKGTFLEGAPIIQVSAKTGENVGVIKDEIYKTAMGVAEKSLNGIFRMPIDRVFTLKGFGTVVTGTVLSGKTNVEDSIEILPAGLRCRIRGAQTHGSFQKTVYAGQRAALNLQGVDRHNLKRGDTVVTSDFLTHTAKLDAGISLLKDAPRLKDRSVVHLHLGTAETTARVILYDKDKLEPGESSFCQFRLDNPIVTLGGDRFIIRRFSPLQTIGGGVTLDPIPYKRRRSIGVNDLDVYLTGTLSDKLLQKIKSSGYAGVLYKALRGFLSEDISKIDRALKTLIDNRRAYLFDDTYFEAEYIGSIHTGIKSILNGFHKREPLKPGILVEELWSEFKMLSGALLLKIAALSPDISVDKDVVSSKGFKPGGGSSEKSEKLLSLIDAAGFKPPSRQEAAAALSMSEVMVSDLIKLLTKEGTLVRITDAVYISRSVHDRMLSLLRDFSAKKKDISVAEFRDLVDTTRKFALPFLEYLDGKRYTLRVGEQRKILI